MENWTYGLLLTALTIVIHATGIAMMAVAGRNIRLWTEGQKLGLMQVFLIMICTLGGIGLLLAVLHGLEAAIWGVAYLHMGAFKSFAEAILYSLDSMTTRGASGLTLQNPWQMMGALEASDGMLLFGISTAFLFAVMQRGMARLMDVKAQKL